MRARTLAALFGVTFAVACLVDRPSEDLTCSTTADCGRFPELRACIDHYCVVQDCPDDCTACDESAKTCQVDCSSADDCSGDITCPDGWNCTIRCIGDGACNDVNCQSGSQCSIVCMGDGACGDIRCDDACQCDLDCVGGACSSMQCPTVGGGGNPVHCTADGTDNTECDSARDSRCAGC